ncbi:MAG: efflux RND transporter permease subunit [Oceanicaulis sp.]
MVSIFYRYPRLTLLALFLIVVSGVAALGVLGRQEDPTLVKRYGNVVAIYPGADAERVEALVVEPIERALLELVEIDEINSSSRANIGFIDISVREDLTADQVEQAWTLIRDQVALAETRLPDGVLPVQVEQVYLGAATLIVSLDWPEGAEGSSGALSRLARDLEDRLRNVAGTEETHVYGDPQEEVRVVLDPESAAALGLTAADVAAILAQSDAKTPAGRIAGDRLDLTLEVAGAFDSLDRLREVPIAQGEAGFLRLGDIATIERTIARPQSAVPLRNAEPVIMVAAFLEPGLQVDAWDARAQAAVAAFAEANPGVEVEIIFDQSSYVIDRLAGLGLNLLFSALIVFAVLFLMMGWRSALIVGSALPLTVLLVMVLINLFDEPLHQMSVTGLVVSLGLLIDNAIVVVDDYKLLRSRGVARLDALEKVIRTLFGPLLASTLTTIFAFGPIALLPGSAGEFVSMIGVSVIFAVSASFVLAFTVILALAAWFDDTREEEGAAPFWHDGLRSKPLAWIYRKALDAIIAQPVLGIAVSLVFPIAGFIAASTLPSQFFPPTERDMFQMRVTLPPGTAIERTIDRLEGATELLYGYEGVEDVVFFIGESGPRVYYNMLGGTQGRPNFAQGFVRTESPEATRRIVTDFQRLARERFPDAQFLAIPFEQGPPRPAPIELQVIGPDLAVLDQAGADIRRALSQVPGVTYTEAQLQLGEPVVRFEADEASASAAGLTLTGLAGRLRAEIDGVVGGSVLEGVEALPVRVVAPDARRGSPDLIAGTPLPMSGSAPVGVGALGPVTLQPETALITRIDGERANPIYAFLDPFVLPAPVLARFEEIRAADGQDPPPGYRIAVGGDAENQGDAMADLMSTALPLFTLMIAAVVLAFNSFRYAGVVFVSGFLSAGLAMFGVWMFGTPLGFNAIIGSLGLVGLSINGTIVVLSALRADPASVAGDPEAIRETVVDATRHILATTLTTMGGFLPLLIEGDSFWLPFASAVAGGVAGSAVLALVFAPSGFVLLSRFDRPRVTHEAAPA